jgi:NTE family protein
MSDQRTALVLGGGGITGIAWEIGVLAGLAEAGTDLTGADLVVGTSAGSVVGALLTSGSDLAAVYERQLAPATGEQVARLNRATVAQFGWAMLRSRGRDVEFRRRIGALALAAEKAGLTPSEQERLDVIGERLAGTQWPAAAGDHRRRRGDR